MDPHWTGAPPSGSLTCMLCRGSVPFSKEETTNFRSHLQHHHGVFYHHDVLISVNLLSKKYLTKIVQDYENSGEKSEFVGEEDSEEIVELEETTESTSNITSKLIPGKNDVRKELKVHNCKTCNMKFERLGDLIEHVNAHKAEEKREQEELDMERKRVLEEKKVAKQREAEKRKLEEERIKSQISNYNGMQPEWTEDGREKRNNDSIRVDITHDDGNINWDTKRSRDISQIRESLRQIRESDTSSNSVGDVNELNDTDISASMNHRPSPVIFECEDCPFKSKRNIELKLHKLKHTQEKSFSCEICDEKFYLERHLKKHQQKHDSVNVDGIGVSSETINMSVSDERMQHTENEEEDTPSMPKKKIKRVKKESLQDDLRSVLSGDSNSSEDSRLKQRASLGLPAGRGVGDVVENSEYFQKFPNQIKKGSSNDASFTEQEPSMPEGWKYKKIHRPSGRIDTEFSSPDFMVFRSRVSMVEYMKYLGQYSQEEIERAERK